MNKTYALTVGIIILIVAGTGLVLAKSKKSAVPNQPAAVSVPAINSRPITIDYTDKGFSPNKLTVKTGQKIIFRNDSSASLWVASGPHPYDNAYPEFNANRSYPPGQDYIFTFARTGVWDFHNHLNESDTGTITVNP